jgi:hypothetical protein
MKQYVPSGNYFETPIYFCAVDSKSGSYPAFYLCKDDEPNYPKDTPARTMW